MITAHGGALGTGRNTRRYFERAAEYRADALEIDVRKKGGLLYISHLPAIFVKRKITLAEAFDEVKKLGLRVNCDIKQRGIVKDVLNLAKEKGIADKVYFTGAVALEDSKDVDAGEVWFNSFNFRTVGITPESAARIKVMIDAAGNPAFKGINIGKGLATDEFMAAANKAGLNVSVYTVDDPREQERILAHNPGNMTTNQPVTAREILEKTKRGD